MNNKPKIITAFCLFVLALCSCSSTPLPREASVAIPEDFFGMVHAGTKKNPKEYELINQMEVKWLLNTFYWRRIEKEKDVFNFSQYDIFTEQAVKENKKIVAVLAYDTYWLYPDGKLKRKVTPENLPHFLHFVEEVVTHYRDTVDVWEIWNEPNIKFWKGSRKDFYELTRVTALKIREIHPEAYILGGVFWRAPGGFIKAMHKAGALEGLDGVAFHPYAFNPVGSMQVYDRFLKTLADINFTGPVWITEAGYPTDGWPLIKAPLEEFPSYVIKTISGAAAR